MCGIVGYVGPRDAASVVVNGLKRLEYRGYDSAGLALLTEEQDLKTVRAVGKLSQLVERLQAEPLCGHIAIGHTRWATHGGVTEQNAHPHLGLNRRVAVVHNGIIENYALLRQELQDQGVIFTSETDTEVIAQLVDAGLQDGELLTAVQRALPEIEGASAFVFLSAREPGRLVAARLGNAGGIVIGLGEGEAFVASDIPAILEHTRRVIFLESGQLAALTPERVEIFDLQGRRLEPTIHVISWDPVAAEKGQYRHFMQKEIAEQPRAITDTIRGRADFHAGRVHLDTLPLTAAEARALRKMTIVACGTSYHAGLVGKFLLENLARLPVEVDYGSEFRYRDPLIGPEDVVLAITQSGETVDTLAAMEEGQARGTRLWSIVNVLGSQAQRSSNGYILMQAGPEIGVASTKAFTTSLVDLYLLALALAEKRGVMDGPALRRAVDDLARLPQLVGQVAEELPLYHQLAEIFHKREHFLYLGRGINYPVALEGALKLKEISYIHAEGYPAGEMKHGPIALIDSLMPVVTLAPRDGVYDKMLSQMEQVHARNGVVIAVVQQGDTLAHERADYVLEVPVSSPYLSPVLNVIPLQWLAYAIAVRRGADVDQPRNLAKSVTVE
ncbi:MAG TPA: glutamine--fructose-6-phosphate transaminase (isomerizing) [Anaerolineae bacterium]|nr:glutamine--fructose-6-phosphate transaminase (isomerizing) [Anaerolineae bacterium]HQM13119.1 glutamine--fructose-6-phosphate transaminase (isomerizing) [Anaerolineae bacterium]